MLSKRFLCLFLVTVMSVPLLFSCNNIKDTDNPDLTPEYTIASEFGKGAGLSFNGADFNILCRDDSVWGNYTHEIIADENSSDVVNKEIYYRNRDIQDHFNIKINACPVPGDWSVKDNFIDKFTYSILAGRAAYDLIMSQQSYMTELKLLRLYTDFYNIPNIDLNADYYFQDFIKECTIDGSLYFLAGDYSLTYWEQLYVMYFNKSFLEDKGESIYDLVKSGKWTIDKCMEMSKGIWKDVNGDLNKSPDDMFGYISDYEGTADALFSTFDVQITSRDKNRTMVLSIDQGKMVSVLEKMIKFYDTKDVYTYKTSSFITENPLDKIFQENRALFYPERLNLAQMFRSSDTDYGIVPLPKWNEKQEGYYTQSANSYSTTVIPIDVKSLELSGAVLDSLSAQNHNRVIPAFFNEALGKNAYDNDSIQMLKYIQDGIKFNFGYLYSSSLGAGGMMRSLLYMKNSDFVSYYAFNLQEYQSNLKNILKQYEYVKNHRQ